MEHAKKRKREAMERLPTGPNRTKALVASMRREDMFCDGTISVNGNLFQVHRVIVAHLCPFFFKAFAGAFSEAGDRKVVVGATTADAMSVVLDFAYGVDVHPAVDNCGELASDVLALAHRFEIGELVKIAGAAAAESVTVENCVRLFSQLKLFNCKDETDRMFMFILKNFQKVAEHCEEFTTLTVGELENIFSSQELIASEMAKYNGIMRWRKHDEESRKSCLSILLSHVRFEVLDLADTENILNDIAFFPLPVLSKFLSKNFLKGVSMTGVCVPDCHYRVDRDTPGTVFALPLGNLRRDFMHKQNIPFFFNCRHWLLSARVALSLPNLHLKLKFEHRHSALFPSLSLGEDLNLHYVAVVTKLMTEKKEPMHPTRFNNLSLNQNARILQVHEFKAPWTLDEFDDEVRGNLTLLIDLRIKEKFVFLR